MIDNEATESELISCDIEISEESLKKFEIIKKHMKEVPDGDYFSCFFRMVLDEHIIKDREPLYCFYENTEKLCKILHFIPQIEVMKKKNRKRKCIKPNECIISTRREIDNLYKATFIESDYLNRRINRELNGMYLSDEIKIFIFLKIVTNIEVYLEDRLTKTLKHHKSLFNKFIKNLGNDMPIKWRNGEKINPYDYYNRMDEIIFENVLLFPYHEISGKTNHFYRKAFNLDLMKYPKRDQLIKIIKNRHIIIHRGSENFTLEGGNFSFEDLEDHIKLSYNFVCWVEDNLKEYDLQETLNNQSKSMTINESDEK